MTQPAHAQGVRLGPETWGNQMRRAREAADLTQTQALQMLAEHAIVNTATLSRLEARDSAPTDRKVRGHALIALLIYGFDPEPFGLTLGDAPPGLDAQDVAPAAAGSRCFLHEEWPELGLWDEQLGKVA